MDDEGKKLQRDLQLYKEMRHLEVVAQRTVYINDSTSRK